MQNFSKEDIKTALFDIDNDKSPGPDQYSSYFKKTWNLLWDDFCDVVTQFFENVQLLRQANHTIIVLIPKSE